VSYGGIFDYQTKREKLEEIEAMSAEPGFWDNPERAQAVSRERAKLEAIVRDIDAATRALDDARTLYELGREEADEASMREAWQGLDVPEKLVAQLEFRRMLSGRYDGESAILSINAGAGGVDSQDWAEMLLRMYCRWGERHGYKVEILDVQEGEQAGIRSAEIAVSGTYAYGWLRSEVGVHRLVRISPFDANARRQTSFTSVMVVPDIEDGDDIDVDVDESDLRVDTYRAGGKGGQHVNKTDSAVRLTHLPSGIVVACQAERSQHSNYDRAMRMLKAKLLQVERDKREAEMASIQGTKRKIEWGSQIRSYVIHPYQQVKDERTGMKSSNVQGVLDGELDEFIEGFLLQSGEPDSREASD
jgi:peptide chain release factor 2